MDYHQPESHDSLELERIRRFFADNASVEQDGVRYMSPEDFARAVSPNQEFYKGQKDGYGLLFQVADRSNRGRLDVEDYINFENVLARPDAGFEIAFRLFDEDHDGRITLDQFRQIVTSNQPKEAVPFDFNSDWMTLFVGKNQKKDITYEEFTQLVKGFQAERLKQEFKYFDKSGTGSISPEDFQKIMLHVAGHKLNPYVVEVLPELSKLYTGDAISFANLRACYNVIRQMDMVERIARKAAMTSPTGQITKADFQNTAAKMLRFNVMTPMEVDVLFYLAAQGKNLESPLAMSAFERLFDPKLLTSPVEKEQTNGVATTADVAALAAEVVHLSAAMEALKSAYNFTLGSVAGAVGATVVYPIDLVKTRMQNQRSKVVGQVLYKNGIDCFKKVVKNEGFKGLYSGLAPQLLGVAPEKAIKLTMNDLVRSHLKDKKTGEIPLWGEILAGCTAGGSQVVFTNPLEIVKIRLQVQGEAAKNAVEAIPRQSAAHIVRQLGLFGLYKGAAACLLRDIPFSGIYFPTYAHLKKSMFDEGKNGKRLNALELLAAGALAGMPAAYLVTPADVIKTRLQVAARKGETTYTGLSDAFVKILREEGPRAFFKGGVARVLRSSPQFGVTLATYEFLQRVFPLNFGETPQTPYIKKAAVATTLGENNVAEPIEVGRRNALRVLNDLSPDLVRAQTKP
ncbi:mitochondrial carrier domain-containing protein [Gaertneriomyces semiglobifer]|nr:mitochondrial carrier domain-containing protein [Gaertneriomyces semiglobifer]